MSASSEVIVTHTVREVADLNYRELLRGTSWPQDEILGELIGPKLRYYPTVTREPFKTQGRITDLIASGQLFRDLGLPAVRQGGGPGDAVRRPLGARRPEAAAPRPRLRGRLHRQPGDFVLERAFVG